MTKKKPIPKTAAAKAPKAKKPPKAEATRDGKLSAIDAAAKVLGESGEPMNAKGMIEAMSAKGYWTSPGGQTPWATLYTVVTMLPNLAP